MTVANTSMVANASMDSKLSRADYLKNLVDHIHIKMSAIPIIQSFFWGLVDS